jgi:hypothetical protein
MLRAIHFLALSLKLWRFAEQEAKALDTLVKLARSADADIRRNVAGAMYRLAMHKSIKRHFVAKVGTHPHIHTHPLGVHSRHCCRLQAAGDGTAVYHGSLLASANTSRIGCGLSGGSAEAPVELHHEREP